MSIINCYAKSENTYLKYSPIQRCIPPSVNSVVVDDRPSLIGLDFYNQMIVYKITNITNNKVYIGKTVQTIEKRWIQHISLAKNKKNRHLYDSINKYGLDKFTIEIIEVAENIEQLNEREIFWIKYYNSINRSFGYNMNEGGTGGRHTDEVIRKIADKKRGQKHTENHKKKISNALKGRCPHPMTDDMKEKISNTLKGRTPKHNIGDWAKGKGGNLHPFFGKKHTIKTRLLISKMGIGRKGSDKQREMVRSKWLNDKNPNYKEVNKELLRKMLLENKNNKEIAIFFKITRATVIEKTKKYFGMTPSEFKKQNKLS